MNDHHNCLCWMAGSLPFSNLWSSWSDSSWYRFLATCYEGDILPFFYGLLLNDLTFLPLSTTSWRGLRRAGKRSQIPLVSPYRRHSAHKRSPCCERHDPEWNGPDGFHKGWMNSSWAQGFGEMLGHNSQRKSDWSQFVRERGFWNWFLSTDKFWLPWGNGTWGGDCYLATMHSLRRTQPTPRRFF
jgi:hypothetical protein